MVKAPSPLLGFNNNVRHKGRVFHIQTEDSGIRHPHIITHLFADGGRILKSTKTSYAEHVGRPGFAETVRAMMQEQHKAMFIALRDGQYDFLFEEAAPAAAGSAPKVSAAAAPASPGPQSKPSVLDLARRGPASTANMPAVNALDSARRPSTFDFAAIGKPAPPSSSVPEPPLPAPPPPPPPPVVEEAPVPPSRQRGMPRPKLEISPEALHARDNSGSAPQVNVAVPAMPAKRGPRESGIDLDLEALERAAAEAQTPFFQQISDLPPPPAAVLGKKRPTTATSGSYSAITVGTPVTDLGNAPRPPLPRRTPPPPPAPLPAGPGAGAGRYAPSRPASIFATTRPPEGASIFGEDLISEKSLDEVILSYLAEDLETSTDKK